MGSSATRDTQVTEMKLSPPSAPDAKTVSAIEAILIAADRATPAARIAEAVGLGESGADEVSAAAGELNRVYEETGRVFRVESVAGGLRLMTTNEHAPALAAFFKGRAASKLSRAAIETLSIIAYRQPVSRAELESIRGVACGEILRSLLERRLVEIVGRADEVGRPMLYGTTRRFLETFGLATIKDLPRVEGPEVEGSAAAKPAPASEPEAREEAVP